MTNLSNKTLSENIIMEKSADFAKKHSADTLQSFCLQEGYTNGYTNGYNQAIDDILLKIAKNDIKGLDRTYPPEALMYVFDKFKI